MRRRFFVEVLAAAVTGSIAVLTATWPDWIERVFRIDPDAGSGSVEWSLTLAAFVLLISFAVLAAGEIRRSALARGG